MKHVRHINELIENYDRSHILEYETRDQRIVIEFIADGGWFEITNLKLVFHDVQVLHLPRVFHCALGLRIANAVETSRTVPSTSFDMEDHASSGAQCFIIQSNGVDTGFYVYGAAVEVHDIPPWWKPGLTKPDGPWE
jgi:hypothetical protein